MDKKNILFVRAKLKDDYVFDAIKSYGFNIVIPYKDNNILLRLMREVWFRLKLPKREIWFNKAVAKSNAEIIIVRDPLITPEYLEWMLRKHANARIVLDYENRADTTINPGSVDERIEKWSYDEYDCGRYSMRLTHPSYHACYSFDSSQYEKTYDVLYVGRDKGRMEKLENLEMKFRENGLKTYFHICANRYYLRYKNKKYKKEMPYKKYIDLMKHSRAILNIARTDQKCMTQRELEAVFSGVKCISNNISLEEIELYDPSRYFLMREDNIDKIPEFLQKKYKAVEKEILDKYKFETVICNMIEQ